MRIGEDEAHERHGGSMRFDPEFVWVLFEEFGQLCENGGIRFHDESVRFRRFLGPGRLNRAQDTDERADPFTSLEKDAGDRFELVLQRGGGRDVCYRRSKRSGVHCDLDGFDDHSRFVGEDTEYRPLGDTSSFGHFLRRERRSLLEEERDHSLDDRSPTVVGRKRLGAMLARVHPASITE